MQGHGTLLGASTSKAYDQVEKTGKRKLGSGRSGVVKKKKVTAR